MKNKILKITCSVLCLFGMASCLGDSVGYNSGSGFAYITTAEYSTQKVAVVLAAPNYFNIVSGVIDTADLEVGDCAFVEFKVYSDRYSNGNWYTDDVKVSKIYPKSEHGMLQLGTPPVVNEVDTVNVLDKFGIGSFASDDLVKDKWYIHYKAELQTYQDARLSFYYDSRAERQTGLSKDTVYIDVRINKATADETKKGSSVDRSAAADFSMLRYALLSGLSEKKAYYIRFRYYTNVKDKNVSKTKETLSDVIGYMQNNVTTD